MAELRKWIVELSPDGEEWLLVQRVGSETYHDLKREAEVVRKRLIAEGATVESVRTRAVIREVTPTTEDP